MVNVDGVVVIFIVVDGDAVSLVIIVASRATHFEMRIQMSTAAEFIETQILLKME